MTLEIRLTQPHEYRLAADAFVVALMVPPPTDEQWERSLPAQEVEAFYDVRPFPGYAPGDTAGSLLDRSRRSAFLDALG